MKERSLFLEKGRNPDILTCIANLSSDEVFTPPETANRILDELELFWKEAHDGKNLWEDSSVRFLDPCTKSGVFLREITRRLSKGLEREMPDLQNRIDHILTNQIFGIGITTLTALMTRRSVYCSKLANGKHSIVTSFSDEKGNIWYEPIEHNWLKGNCTYCGANKKKLERKAGLENHAYSFIHQDDPEPDLANFFGGSMKFDVIIGNPPYQLSDGGGKGSSSKPIYNLFVEQAKKLNPKFISMIIPSRWFTGGKGLDNFRKTMLEDKRIRALNDYVISSDIFPGVALKGGVCYFLWDRDNPGICDVTTHFKDEEPILSRRPLQEKGADVFVRFNQGLAILKKIVKVEGGKKNHITLPDSKNFDELVSIRNPFGFNTTFKGKKRAEKDDVLIYKSGGSAFVARKNIKKNNHLIDKWKIFIGFAAPGTGNKDTYPHKIISTPFLGKPGSICTETYLCIGSFSSKKKAENALKYLSCRLTRLLILMHKPSHNTTRKVYKFVPIQDWSIKWSDQKLYKKYQLTDEEIAFIEKVVRPMELS